MRRPVLGGLPKWRSADSENAAADALYSLGQVPGVAHLQSTAAPKAGGRWPTLGGWRKWRSAASESAAPGAFLPTVGQEVPGIAHPPLTAKSGKGMGVAVYGEFPWKPYNA